MPVVSPLSSPTHLTQRHFLTSTYLQHIKSEQIEMLKPRVPVSLEHIVPKGVQIKPYTRHRQYGSKAEEEGCVLIWQKKNK